MHTMPEAAQQPREKLLANPPSELNTEELMSVILGTGTQGNSVRDLSRELVGYLRANLNGNITVEDLLKFKGVGKKKALQIISALELGGRFRINRQKLNVSPAGHGEFICGDCLESMKTLADDSIILAFTSPPYHNAINYADHVKKMNGEIRHWERTELSYDFYKTFLVDRFKELLRVIAPGGHNIVNLSPVAWQGRRVPLPFHFVGWMEDIGWQFKEDIIWEKGVVRDKRSGVLMQHPYPGYYYPSLAVEYVLVFQKPAPKKSENNIYHNRSQAEKKDNLLNLDGYQEQSKNVWNIRPVAPQENIHPCPFPEELARRVVQYYSYKNDTVLDIFSGSGVTNVAAEQLGRKHIGMEIEKKYIEAGVSAVNKVQGLFNGK